MKEKIEHISKGEFQITNPEIIFPETHLVLKIGEGEMYKGSFDIENLVDGDIRGAVYSSSFRMKTKEPGFQGNKVTVRFTYNGAGLHPGHVEDGAFTIVSNGGEYRVTYTVIIEKPFLQTSVGKIQDLRGFKKLAFHDFEEAKRIFRSREFYELIKYEDSKILHIYSHMRTWSLTALGMEEFLVGIKQKEKIFLSLEAYQRIFRDLTENVSESILIKKNTWGFAEVNVKIEADFIDVAVERFNTEDFSGEEYQLVYTVRENRLHNGRNLGKIILETAHESVEYHIEAQKNITFSEGRRHNEFIKARLLKLYLQLEGAQISSEDWYTKTINAISEFDVPEGESAKYKLYQAHACIIGGQHEEARWILENYSYNKYTIGRDVELDAYYLYLIAVLKKDSSQTKKSIEELQKNHMRNSKSWKVLCMLIQLDPYYNDMYERKQALEVQFNQGARNSVIYLEALKTFKVRTSNLKKLGDFEIQVLRFANKYQLMTNELALYMANLASQQKQFDKAVFDLLAKSYEQLKDPMILTAICTILIKGDVVDPFAFKWYELAVHEEIKIARLYEYFMTSVEPDSVKEALPRAVHLYFAHGNSLTYDKAALLYANLIQFEDDNTELYGYYREEIRIFAIQQLEMRRITPELKVIYRKILDEKNMNMEQMKAIYDISHAYLVTTKMTNIRSVQVIRVDGSLSEKVPYTKNGARITLYDLEDTLVWETHLGERYIGSIRYESFRLFYELKFIEMSKKHLGIISDKSDIKEDLELTFDNLAIFGIGKFDRLKVLEMCSTKILELTFEKDEFLVYICQKLFARECYDKVTVTYLVAYYVGATINMKAIWHAARDFSLETNKLAENIISQGIFSEQLFNDEEIFLDYYENGPHFRLLKAYLSLSAREYIMYNRQLPKQVITVILKELHEEKEVSDIVRIAILKHFAYSKYNEKDKNILKACMQILCEKQIYFAFFQRYGQEWLMEVKLWDKILVSCDSKHDGKMKLYYRVHKIGAEVPEFQSEVLTPMFENVFVKKFMIFEDEQLSYYFEEILEDRKIKNKVYNYIVDKENKYIGKYGRLNSIINNPTLRDEKMKDYVVEEAMANRIFVPYE